MIVYKDLTWKKYVLRFVRYIFPTKFLDYITFFVCNRYLPNILTPKTFNENILYIKHNVKDLRMISLSDKYKVREYVKNKIGSEYLPNIIYIGRDISGFTKVKLTDNFIVKPTNGSGFYYLNVNEKPDLNRINKLYEKWINLNYYSIGGEWQYKNINQNIIVEELLFDSDGTLANDFKVHCFRNDLGQLTQIVEVHDDRFNEHSQTFFNDCYEQLDIEKHSNFVEYKFPDNFPKDKILELSAILSEGFGYVRVDWYCCSGRLYFGEMTFTPGNALSPFKNKDWDIKLGNLF
ncbi:TPA: ATP-grasp fold amidoligase family protein [Photobacterium damselae]